MNSIVYSTILIRQSSKQHTSSVFGTEIMSFCFDITCDFCCNETERIPSVTCKWVYNNLFYGIWNYYRQVGDDSFDHILYSQHPWLVEAVAPFLSRPSSVPTQDPVLADSCSLWCQWKLNGTFEMIECWQVLPALPKNAMKNKYTSYNVIAFLHNFIKLRLKPFWAYCWSIYSCSVQIQYYSK